MDVLIIPCDLERRHLRHKAYFMNSPWRTSRFKISRYKTLKNGPFMWKVVLHKPVIRIQANKLKSTIFNDTAAALNVSFKRVRSDASRPLSEPVVTGILALRTKSTFLLAILYTASRIWTSSDCSWLNFAMRCSPLRRMGGGVEFSFGWVLSFGASTLSTSLNCASLSCASESKWNL